MIIVSSATGPKMYRRSRAYPTRLQAKKAAGAISTTVKPRKGNPLAAIKSVFSALEKFIKWWVDSMKVDQRDISDLGEEKERLVHDLKERVEEEMGTAGDVKRKVATILIKLVEGEKIVNEEDEQKKLETILEKDSEVEEPEMEEKGEPKEKQKMEEEQKAVIEFIEEEKTDKDDSKEETILEETTKETPRMLAFNGEIRFDTDQSSVIIVENRHPKKHFSSPYPDESIMILPTPPPRPIEIVTIEDTPQKVIRQQMTTPDRRHSVPMDICSPQSPWAPEEEQPTV